MIAEALPLAGAALAAASAFFVTLGAHCAERTSGPDAVPSAAGRVVERRRFAPRADARTQRRARR